MKTEKTDETEKTEKTGKTEKSKKRKASLILSMFLMAIIFSFASMTFAGTTGEEWKGANDYFDEKVSGYGGRFAAMASLAVGIVTTIFLMGKSYAPLGVSVVIAIACAIGPNLITGIASATL